MRDFTINIFRKLIQRLQSAGYSFLTFEEFARRPGLSRFVILRHDVDRLPKNALKMAKVEKSLGVSSSYYFRIVPFVWDEEIIREVASLGHEVAYHYEDLTITKGDHNAAIKHFAEQLKRIRQFYPSKTICMHGSPLSKWDNRDIWEKYNYKDYGIIAEPYFDVDYSKVFYITDTGRAWNNKEASIRDKVDSGFKVNINSTDHLISLINNNELPNQLFINAHSHRWSDNLFDWSKEYVIQNLKNVVKRLMVQSK